MGPVRHPASRAGFTLIELLVAAAIIGVLAAVAVGLFQDAQRKAKYARARVDTQTALQAAIRYSQDFNAYPRSLAVLRSTGYMNVPDKDPWGSNYRVSSNISGQAVPDPQVDAWVCSQGPRGGRVLSLLRLRGQHRQRVSRHRDQRLGRLLLAVRRLDRVVAQASRESPCPRPGSVACSPRPEVSRARPAGRGRRCVMEGPA